MEEEESHTPTLNGINNYYDIEGFLAEDQKVPCAFAVDYYDESYIIGLEDNIIPEVYHFTCKSI